MGTTEIKRIIRDYYKQLYPNKFHTVDEMGKKILEKLKLPKLTQEEMENQIYIK